jgi:hypothetical protein
MILIKTRRASSATRAGNTRSQKKIWRLLLHRSCSVLREVQYQYTMYTSQVIGLWEVTWEGESTSSHTQYEMRKAINGVTKPIYEYAIALLPSGANVRFPKCFFDIEHRYCNNIITRLLAVLPYCTAYEYSTADTYIIIHCIYQPLSFKGAPRGTLHIFL